MGKIKKKTISLDEFIESAKSDIDKFREFWIKNHDKNPKNFPMSLPTDNAGLWWEMFNNFDGG